VDKQTWLEPIRRPAALIGAGIAAALGLVAVLAWPALMRADPPLETSAPLDQQMRINLVQPPRAVAAVQSERLDVGLPAAATALTPGRPAQADATPPPRLPSPERRPEPEAALINDTPPPPSDRRARSREARWERDRWDRETAEAEDHARWDRQRRAEEARQAREDRDQDWDRREALPDDNLPEGDPW